MERMTKIDENIQTAQNLLSGIVERCYELEEENKKLKEDVDFFRQCYLDLKKLCEKEGFMLSDEEVTKMFNLDDIKQGIKKKPIN